MANQLNHVMSCEHALICSSLYCRRQVGCLNRTDHQLGVAALTSKTDVVWKVNLWGSTSMGMHLKMGHGTCSAYTKEVWCQAPSSSGYGFWDERLRWALQECSGSQELWLCWKQPIPFRTWTRTPVSPPPSLPCFKNLGDLKWKPFNL